MMDNRGYYGIGVENLKTKVNLGTLWRSAYCFGASFIFVIGSRYKKQSSDTVKAWRHIPFYEYNTKKDFITNRPHDCQIIGVEISNKAKDICSFMHPERALYVLGPEDGSLSFPNECQYVIKIPSKYCLNVATAGAIVLYDRVSKAVKR